MFPCWKHLERTLFSCAYIETGTFFKYLQLIYLTSMSFLGFTFPPSPRYLSNPIRNLHKPIQNKIKQKQEERIKCSLSIFSQWVGNAGEDTSDCTVRAYVVCSTKMGKESLFFPTRDKVCFPCLSPLNFCNCLGPKMPFSPFLSFQWLGYTYLPWRYH